VQGVAAMLQLNFRSDLTSQAFSIHKISASTRISLRFPINHREISTSVG
jgi:hypothetical protein